MQLIEQMGIFPDRYIREKRPALRSVVQAVIATIRMRFAPTFSLVLVTDGLLACFTFFNFY